ncbi:MAG TPA: AgmX/PglI C-terminal domain-containing protein [Nitrospirota bacterium]|nr:AgmX/PglI C-terminal domain-containing protein [Nitrospirota bacterium]
MTTSLLAEELARLREQIGHVRRKQEALTGELRLVEAELERLSADRPRFDALQDVCSALDKLKELKADELFWEGVAEARQAAGHRERVKSRVARFEGEIRGILEKQASLKDQINQCLDELSLLDEEVRDAYGREARREEEYVIEREISPVPDRAMSMPWSGESESERHFRKALLVALLLAFFLGTLIPLLKMPVPVRPAVVVVPERLVSMLKKEPPRPEPPKEEKKPVKDQEEKAPKEDRPEPTIQETQAARKKAEGTGLLALKNDFKDLMDETPAARLGTGARLSNQPAAGSAQARTYRSLVAMPSTGAGSSGGIGSAEVSRTIGHDHGDRIGGVGLAPVQSTVAVLEEEARPVSSGPGPARTDEEIQIVFDKYKATLYRIYNAELRKNPTLRGKIVLRITIEPGGEVSLCTVQSNDLASPDLVDQIVARVKKFNFGPKEKVPQTIILYPIDFLPGG